MSQPLTDGGYAHFPSEPTASMSVDHLDHHHDGDQCAPGSDAAELIELE
jgi:hypothetical protein